MKGKNSNMELKKFIDIHVPISTCNFKCTYCYVPQTKLVGTEKTIFKYTPDVVKKGLTIDRLGGTCHFNVCGLGETLIPNELFSYIKAILENGHTVMIVTNGTLTNRIKEYCNLSKDLKSRLGFKFSFHYLELKRLNMTKIFFDNINLVKKNGISFSVEITANDDYEPYIEDIKKVCLENVGALPHVSVPRNEAKKGIDLLSNHSLQEFYNIWSTFDSPMFEFKIRHWGERRKEYCCSGLWSGLLDLGSGTYSPCYGLKGMGQDIFKDVNKKINFFSTGKCKISHCYNAHSFLTLGTIPEINEERYIDIRDRISSIDNTHWMTGDLANQISNRLLNFNTYPNKGKKISFFFQRHIMQFKTLIKKILKR